VVLTDASLTKAQCRKVAAVAHDGLARAVRPVHGMFDGDTVFCLASGARPAPAGAYGAVTELDTLLGAAADTFSAACLDAMLSATGRGAWPAYRDLVETATPDRPPVPRLSPTHPQD
jgi:L-aminopeptidase/D-esterase-like protein